MAVKNYVQAIPSTSLNAAGLGAYQAINGGGLPHACFLVKIINDSNVAVIISYDGVTDHDEVPANQTAFLPFQSNNQPSNFVALMKQGTIVYARGAAGVGTIYLVGYYQN